MCTNVAFYGLFLIPRLVTAFSWLARSRITSIPMATLAAAIRICQCGTALPTWSFHDSLRSFCLTSVNLAEKLPGIQAMWNTMCDSAMSSRKKKKKAASYQALNFPLFKLRSYQAQHFPLSTRKEPRSGRRGTRLRTDMTKRKRSLPFAGADYPVGATFSAGCVPLPSVVITHEGCAGAWLSLFTWRRCRSPRASKMSRIFTWTRILMRGNHQAVAHLNWARFPKDVEWGQSMTFHIELRYVYKDKWNTNSTAPLLASHLYLHT